MNVQSALAQGRGLMAIGRHGEAVSTLQQAAYHRPDYPDVHHQLALALSLAGEPLRAESHLQRALELNPDYAEAHLNLAILLFERGAYHGAREHLREFDRLVRRAEGGLPEAALDDLAKRHAGLGERYRTYGLLEEAEVELRAAVQLRPEYCDLRLRLALVLFERVKLAEALDELERLLHQHPDYDEALLLLGRVHLESGDLEAARETWERVRQGNAAVQARAFLDGLGPSRAAAELEPQTTPSRAWGTP